MLPYVLQICNCVFTYSTICFTDGVSGVVSKVVFARTHTYSSYRSKPARANETASVPPMGTIAVLAATFNPANDCSKPFTKAGVSLVPFIVRLLLRQFPVVFIVTNYKACLIYCFINFLTAFICSSCKVQKIHARR